MNLLALSHAALWLIVVLDTVLLWAILRELGRRGALKSGLEQGPAVGQRMDTTELVALSGSMIQPSLGQDESYVFFLAAGCKPCKHLLRALGELGEDIVRNAVFIIHGSTESADELATAHGIAREAIVVDRDGGIGRAWNIASRPFLVVLHTNMKVIRSGSPESRDQLVSLLGALPSIHPFATEVTVGI